MLFHKSHPLKGEITVPGDKSISHRGIMLGALANGTTSITNFLKGADCLSTISCFQKMGIEIEETENEILVHGKGLHGLSAPKEILDAGNSGTTTRLISGILAGQNFSCDLTGDASIQKRPMKRIMTPLSMMGADITSVHNNGCAPLHIKGAPLKGISYQSPVASALETFYGTLIEKIDGLNIQKVMKRKNPYLYRAKAMQSATEIVDSVLTAFVSSSEETIFGNCFFEPIAIAASGGNKALAEGIDIMIQNNETNTISAIAVKSGPSVFNADSKKRQEQNFTAASKLAQQAKARYEAYIGYCYGKKKESGRGKPKMYQELAGKRFWAELTGDEDFYIKIIGYMGTMPEKYVADYKESYNRAANRLVREFSNSFCREDGSIDWEKLVEFNSGD